MTVKETAIVLKQTYTQQRRDMLRISFNDYSLYVPPKKYDGEEPYYVDGERIGKKRESLWTQLAEVVLENKIYPRVYIIAQFVSAMAYSSRIPEPPQFLFKFNGHYQLPEKYIKNYSEFASTKEEQIRKALETESEIATNELNYLIKVVKQSPKKAYENLVFNNLNGLSPLFRYCFLAQLAETDIYFQNYLPNFEEKAVIEYINFKQWYDNYWEGLLPLSLKEKAPLIYKKIVRIK